MGKASSSKKIQRVQRAGAKRTSGQRRPLGFPLALAAIIILGTLLAVAARQSKVNASDAAPQANKDHWHYAYGVYQCDNYPDALQKLTDTTADVLGIHTHGDGLIHIHPFSTTVSGKRANLQAFADQVGMTLSDSKISFPDTAGGVVLKNNSTCKIDGKKVKAVLRVFEWPPQANDKVDPEVFESDFGAVRFKEDGGIVVIALVPEGTKTVPLPASIEALKDPLASEGSNVSPETTTTVIDSETTTTQATSETTTTVVTTTTGG